MTHPNEELLRQAWAAYDRGDEGFAACLTDDWREYDTGGDSATLEDERETMRRHRVAFPDKHTEIPLIVADDELVACYSTTSGTHTGRYLDLEPTGKRFAINEILFNRVCDGKLCETWAIIDSPGSYEQIASWEPPETLGNMG